MSKPHREDLSHLTMLELFRAEVETQAAALTSGLLELERAAGSRELLDLLMRAAHSIKGAARIVNLQSAGQVAHAMEDVFVAAQQAKLELRQAEIDVLLRGVDLVSQLSKRTEARISKWDTEHAPEIRDFLQAAAGLLARYGQTGTSASDTGRAGFRAAAPESLAETLEGQSAFLPAIKEGGAVDYSSHILPARRHETPERVVRLTAESLNRLLALAGESLVESRWLRPFADSLERLKRQQSDLSDRLDHLRRELVRGVLSPRAEAHVNELVRTLAGARQFLAERVEELDMFDRRSAQLSHRLYLEALRTRMCPFSDGVRRFPRMVRDLARSLGKEVRFEALGENTQVDRDILERLETPLAHLLRNAVDHGCETPAERRRAGKPPEGIIRIEAHHSAGMLLVTVSDDGAGVAPERLRQAIVQKKLAPPGVAQRLSETELVQFLFLPGFTLKETVTEISGRGVGLDVVQNMVRSVRGAIRLSTQPGRGLRVQLQLPLTLSVLRALLVEIAGEPYAIPLTQIVRAVRVACGELHSLEGRHHFNLEGQHVGLLAVHRVLGCGEMKPPGNDLSVVVLGDRNTRYGLVVDRFLGQRELIVQTLDGRLGKVKDIAAAALMEDGSPVLIMDVDDLIQSIEKLLAGGDLEAVRRDGLPSSARAPKRILAVDDSLTVRELERKILASRGYVADVAVDGMDGWNAVRSLHYDLVVTDVDMPRLDGVELVSLIKKDPQLKDLPVMIISYKDGDEDRLRGLEAGADYYLTKGSFHDQTLLQAVVDLIGEPDA